VPAVDAWRREARWRERWSLAPWQLAMALLVLGVLALAIVKPIAAVFLGVGFAVPLAVILAEYLRFRRDRAVRIVVRFDRPWAVPNRSHWHGRALAQNWNALVTEAQARNIPNPEAFLAVASDTTAWFPVREGLDVFQALGESPPGAPARADLTLLVDALSTAPPLSPSTEPLRFRLEYVDAQDRRSANELFASGYCVGQTRDLRA
jgi:hypothetical protein